MDSKTLAEHPYVDDSLVIDDPETEAKGKKRGGLHGLDWRQAIGALAIVAGLVCIVGGWIGMSGTPVLSEQLTFLFSGGFGGAGLVAVGGIMLAAFEHHSDRMVIAELDRKIVALHHDLRSTRTR